MYDLIYRSLKKRTSEAEEAELRAWRAANLENERQYQDLARLSSLVEEMVFGPDSPPPSSAAALVQRASETGPKARAAGSRWIGKWSGGVGILAAASVGWLLLIREPDIETQRFTGREFATQDGSSQTIVLEDRTVVRLAPGSRLQLAGGDQPREVFLDGVAYFDVTNVADLQFRVHTEAGEAVVLGTRFELRTQGSELRLVVVEGRVALEADSNPLVVEGGEMSRIVAGQTAEPVKVDDVRSLIPWVQRFLVFRETPLAEVARELEEAYGVRIEVRDTALARETVSGRYADMELAEVLNIVCEITRATTCSLENGIGTLDRL